MTTKLVYGMPRECKDSGQTRRNSQADLSRHSVHRLSCSGSFQSVKIYMETSAYGFASYYTILNHLNFQNLKKKGFLSVVFPLLIHMLLIFKCVDKCLAVIISIMNINYIISSPEPKAHR